MTTLMTSPGLVVSGSPDPLLRWVPPRVSSASAEEALALTRSVGLVRDPWQRAALRDGLGELADGSWAAIEVLLQASRRNGKNEVGAVDRELAGLYVFEEGILVHTAHRMATALKAHARIRKVIESNPKLAKRVRKAPASNSQGYGFILDNDCELWFETRTEKVGRGGDADVLIVDEALYATEDHMGAVIPLILARPNPQIWYLTSAPDQLIHPAKVVAKLHTRGRKRDPRLCVIVYGAEGSLDDHDPTDRRLWWQANPSLNGGRSWSIREDTVAAAQRSMPRRKFAVEVLGLGDYPAVEEDGVRMVLGGKVSAAAWLAAQTEPVSERPAACAFGIETAPDGTTSVGQAFLRLDGARQLEVIDRREGQLWVPDFVVAEVTRRDPVAVVIDPASTAATLIPALKDRGIDVTLTTTRQVGQAWAGLVTGIKEARPAGGQGFAAGGVVHPGEPLLDEAALAVQMRTIGDLYAAERSNASAPLWAAVLGLWALGSNMRPAPPPQEVPADASFGVRDLVDVSAVGF